MGEASRWTRIRSSRTLSALEVILTTLHSGGKFGGDAYATSGGLHGVGSSVVNALSEVLEVEVARDRTLWRQSYARGKPTSKLVNAGAVQNRRGTTIRFKPDPEIFGKLEFSPVRLYRLCRSKAYLFRGVQIRWTCDPALLKAGQDVPAEALLHFPGGLRDSLAEDVAARRWPCRTSGAGEADLPVRDDGRPGGAERSGRSPGWRVRTVPALLLQHRADAAGGHPRGGVPRRVAEGRARLGGAAQQPPRGADHRGGRDGQHGRQAVAFVRDPTIPRARRRSG